MRKTLIILPTYNEKENLPVVLIKILSQESFDVLIIDDNSPDGTVEIARHWCKTSGRIHLIERPAKLGLGTAYITGFKWGLERGYDCFIEMDSDLSHNPLDLSRFVDEIEKDADLVIGSRYMNRSISVVGWGVKRLILSKFGNYYASKILNVPITDMTSGFRAFSRRALEALPLDRIKSRGYAFQVEMAYLVWKYGLCVKEISIIFYERTVGESKMSKNITREAAILVWKLRFYSLIEGLGNFLCKSGGGK